MKTTYQIFVDMVDTGWKIQAESREKALDYFWAHAKVREGHEVVAIPIEVS